MAINRDTLERRVMDLLVDLDLDPAHITSVTFEPGRPIMVVRTTSVVGNGRERALADHELIVA